MKSVFILLSLAGAFALAQDVSPQGMPAGTECLCESNSCLQTWPESCHCANDNAQRCFDKCGGVQPPKQECSAPAPPTEQLTTPTKPDGPTEPACTCDQVVCAQSWPESCLCQNRADQRCFEKCGGPKIAPKQCAAAAPAPETRDVPTCSFKHPACTKQYPMSCECENAIALAKFTACGGPEIPPKQCATVEAEPAPETPEVETCVFEHPACTKQFPMSCECENAIALAKFTTCGGPKIAPKDCAALTEAPSAPETRDVETCTFKQPACTKQFPMSCECENAITLAKFTTCGGPKIAPKDCAALAAAKNDGPTCEPEPLLCSTLHPVTCQCQNAMALAKVKKCGGPTPAPKDCSVPDTIIAPREALTCEVEPLLCSTLHPVTCECQNAMAFAKFKKCGGPKIAPKDCSAPAPVIAPREAVACEVEPLLCSTLHPVTCECQNAMALAKFKKCGGPKIAPKDCSAPAPALVPKAATPCECEPQSCIALWPQSCYCANAAREQCFQKCGGKKPTPQSCPPLPSQTLATSAKPTPTLVSPPTGTHKVCGGGRANNISCDKGFLCIADPFTSSCGPACDAMGICVSNKMCGGLAGIKCTVPGQVCKDDPTDSCDPTKGGADCKGLCVWPH